MLKQVYSDSEDNKAASEVTKTVDLSHNGTNLC